MIKEMMLRSILSLQYPSFLFPGTTQYETGKAPKNLKIKTLINSIESF